jgi:hypothetical protein
MNLWGWSWCRYLLRYCFLTEFEPPLQEWRFRRTGTLSNLVKKLVAWWGFQIRKIVALELVQMVV